jgi:TetR/AcrR family transcriptional regulator
MTTEKKVSRKEHILQALAIMLENQPGGRITTAALAKEVGVTEAALYRHFPSKAKMFEALIEFVEEVVFSRINVILQESQDVQERCEQIVSLLLIFSERNPGITRILNGDALIGEHERLQVRIVQFFDRVETQLKMVLRDGELQQKIGTRVQAPAAAALMLTYIDGRMSQFVRSTFKRKPTEHFATQWSFLTQALFYSISV